MLLTLGKDAKTRLTAIAAGKAPPEPNKALAEAQAAAVARDLFYYLDLTPVLSVVGSLTEEQRLAALGKGGGNPIPVRLHGGRRRRREAVDRRPDRAAGGVCGHRDAGRGGHRRQLGRWRARGSRARFGFASLARSPARPLARARIASLARRTSPSPNRARARSTRVSRARARLASRPSSPAACVLFPARGLPLRYQTQPTRRKSPRADGGVRSGRGRARRA